MKNRKSLNRTLVFAATLAALGVSVGVPVEPALAAQLPGAEVVRVPRARPVELAFSLVEQPGQTQGTADSSTRRTEIAAFEAYRVQKRGMRNGSKRGMGDGSVRQGTRPGTSMGGPGPGGGSRLKKPGPVGHSRLKNPGSFGRGRLKVPGAAGRH